MGMLLVEDRSNNLHVIDLADIDTVSSSGEVFVLQTDYKGDATSNMKYPIKTKIFNKAFPKVCIGNDFCNDRNDLLNTRKHKDLIVEVVQTS